MDDKTFLLWFVDRMVLRFAYSKHSEVVNRLALIAFIIPAGRHTPSMMSDSNFSEIETTSDRGFLFWVSHMLESPNMDYNHKIRSIGKSFPIGQVTE